MNHKNECQQIRGHLLNSTQQSAVVSSVDNTEITETKSAEIQKKTSLQIPWNNFQLEKNPMTDTGIKPNTS